MPRADPSTTVRLTLKSTDLSLFNLADHTGYNEITLELNTCFLYRRYGLNIARKSSLHVDQPAAVDPIVFNDRLLRVVEVIHMSAKHERCAAAGSLQRSDDIGSALLDFLVLDLHSQFF